MHPTRVQYISVWIWNIFPPTNP